MRILLCGGMCELIRGNSGLVSGCDNEGSVSGVRGDWVRPDIEYGHTGFPRKLGTALGGRVLILYLFGVYNKLPVNSGTCNKISCFLGDLAFIINYLLILVHVSNFLEHIRKLCS